MRFPLSATLALVASLGIAAACGSTTTTTEEPVATATASEMTPPDPTTEPTSTAPTATAPPTASATSTTPQPPAKLAWKDRNRDQKMELMKAEVLPQMSKMFQEFDGKKFAKMDCASCHGKDKTFMMPNPGLPKLDPTDNFKKHATKNPKMLEFMFKVTPAMAQILNTPGYDPATQTGFGCTSCHTMEAGKGPKKP